MPLRPPGPSRSGSPAPPGGRLPAAVRWLLGAFIVLLAGLGTAGTALATTPTPEPPAGEQTGEQTGGAGDESGIRVSGTLRNAEGEFLEGVTVTAVGVGGSQTAETESDADGRWELFVAEPGTYTFRIDEDTVPEGTQVLQGEVTREVAPGTLNTVIFRFGEERSGLGNSFASLIVRLLVDGIRFGLIIGITAIGLSLIFGTTGLTNFAHGELVTIGAVVAWAVNVLGGVQLIWATIIAIAVGAVFGALNELGVWRPLRRRGAGLIAQLVVSIGLALVLRYLVLIFFGGRSESFADYTGQVARDYGPFLLTDKDLSAIVISIIVLLGIAVLLQRTRIGKAMRAVADNRDLAASSGIDVDRVVLFVWMLGGGLATLGGVLFGLSELSSTVYYEMGFRLLLLMFAGVVLGGLGTTYGALVGCLIVGILVQMSTLVLPVDLKYLGGLAVLIVILVIRPQGILGSKARIG
jgi:neutral amino acid transport system permease protein